MHTVTSNATNMETALRNENNTASTMVTTLKDELEKRLKDIMNLREERDTLQVSCSILLFFVIIWSEYDGCFLAGVISTLTAIIQEFNVIFCICTLFTHPTLYSIIYIIRVTKRT